MIFNMDLISLAILISSLVSLFLGLIVFLRGERNKINRTFSFFVFSVVYWSLGMIFYRTAQDETSSLLMSRFLYLAPVFIVVNFVIFSYLFPDKNKEPSLYLRVILSGSIIIFFWILFFTNGILEGVFLIPGQEKFIKFGNFYFVYFIFISGLFLWSYINLLKTFFYSKGIVKVQAQYIFWGTFISSILGMITNLLLPSFGVFRLNWAGQIFTLIMVGFITYAIIKHRLWGVRVIASKIFIYLLLAIFLYSAFYLTLCIENQLFGGPHTFGGYTFGFFLAIFFGSLFVYFFGLIQEASDELFFKGKNPKNLIKEIALKFNSVIDLKHLVEMIRNELVKTLETKNIRIVFSSDLKKSDNIEVWVADKKSIKKEIIKKSNALYREMSKNKKIVFIDDVERSLEKKELVKLLKKYKAKIAAPLIVRGEVIGAILLSGKKQEKAYTREDFEFLEIISFQAAVAIENAKLYKEVNDFNRKLQKEISQATQELKKSNEEFKDMNSRLADAYARLHKLDKAKSEFLSIASHQLRTPLTSIRGFVSMLLEGAYGQAPKSFKPVLKKVEISNDRLINLVNQLLNVSRIEAGKMEFHFEKGDLTGLIKEVVNSFEVILKDQDLKVIYKGPRNKLSAIYFDRLMIKEVFSNIIDNAIKYSKKGEVIVSLKDKKDKVVVEVRDEGMGIRKEDREYIFEKFQRGDGADKVHTEGVGVGLFLCKKMINAHKGKILVQSAGIGKGSTFIVEFKKSFNPTYQKNTQVNDYNQLV